MYKRKRNNRTTFSAMDVRKILIKDCKHREHRKKLDTLFNNSESCCSDDMDRDKIYNEVIPRIEIDAITEKLQKTQGTVYQQRQWDFYSLCDGSLQTGIECIKMNFSNAL